MTAIPIPRAILDSYIRASTTEDQIIPKEVFIADATNNSTDHAWGVEKRTAYFNALHTELSGSDKKLSLKELFDGLLSQSITLSKRLPDMAFRYFKANYPKWDDTIPRDDFRHMALDEALKEISSRRPFDSLTSQERKEYFSLSDKYYCLRKTYPFLRGLYNYQLVDTEALINEHPEITPEELETYKTVKKGYESRRKALTHYNGMSPEALKLYFDAMYDRYAGDDGKLTFTEIILGQSDDTNNRTDAKFCDDFKLVLDKEPDLCATFNAYYDKFGYPPNPFQRNVSTPRTDTAATHCGQ